MIRIRTKKLCEKFEEFASLLTVLDIEFQLKVFHGFNFTSASTKEEILTETNNISNKIKTINELRETNYQLSTIANQLIIKKPHPKKLKTLEKILTKKEAEILTCDSQPNFKTSYYLNSAFGHFFHCSEDMTQEYSFKKRLLVLFHAHPHFIENNLEQYWAAQYNFISICSRMDKEKEMLDSIKDLKLFTSKIPEFHRKNTLIYLVEIFHQYKKYDFKTIENVLEPLTLEHLKTVENQQHPGVIRTFISLSLVALATGNQTKVQYYLRRLFESGKKMDESYGYFFEVFNFISHYEAKDMTILQNLLTSKKRKMKRDASFGSPFFKEIVQLFNHLLEEENDVKTLINNFKNQLPQHHDDSLYILMKHFILDNWIQALEKGNSYSNQIKLNSNKTLVSN